MSKLMEKSFRLSVRAVVVYKKLGAVREFDIARQLLRSGTSVAANIAESKAAESSRDYVHKLYISLKEIKELRYWCRLVKEVFILEDLELLALISEVEAMLVATIKKVKIKLQYPN